MPPVFYRNNPSLLDGHLARWEGLSAYEVRALAWNLRYDFRVSIPRSEMLVSRVAAVAEAGIDPLQKALIGYHKETVQSAASPSFLRGNDENIVLGGGSLDVVHPRLPLGTILDLTALAPTFREARLQGHPAFKRFRTEDQIEYQTDSRNARAWNGFLEKRFMAKDEAGREEFLDEVFYALSKFPRHPVWVTSWDRLQANLKAPRCLEILGAPRRDGPRILLALRYEARDAGTLVRPCQLDAGDFAYHYPSPPKRALKDGGATMDLAVPRGMGDLVPEFIHSQVRFKVEYWKAANHWLEITSGPVMGDLAGARRQHQRLLQARYGTHNPPWMEEFSET
jgi:hypothetical protein